MAARASTTSKRRSPVPTNSRSPRSIGVKACPVFAGHEAAALPESATSLTPEIVAVGIDEKLLRIRRFGCGCSVAYGTRTCARPASPPARPSTSPCSRIFRSPRRSFAAAPHPRAFPSTSRNRVVYVVELHARDKLGRDAVDSGGLVHRRQVALSWARRARGVRAQGRQKSYLPGETAHVLVERPTTAKALVVIEEPGGNLYSWKQVSGSKVVVDVKIGDHRAPNLPLRPVVLMRGRIGEGSRDDVRYKPLSAAATLELEVEPVKNQLKVNVQHPEVARPGSKQDFIITLADDTKKPVGGEVTFWLVDEGGAVAGPQSRRFDPLTELIRRNVRTTTIHDSRNLVVGRLSEQEEEPGGDGDTRKKTIAASASCARTSRPCLTTPPR